MPEPMYRLIAGDMRQKIESGELGRGAPLPREIEFMEQYRASRNTIRDAVKMLTALGLVETRRSQGTFVVEKIDPFVTTLGPDSGFGSEAESPLHASEAAAAGRRLEASSPRDPRFRRPAEFLRANCSWPKAHRSSAGISSATSTAFPIRCRPRSTR